MTGHAAPGHGATDSAPQPRFDVAHGDGQRPATVRASGDIDVTSADRFLDALTEAAATSTDVTADMTAVTYCDSAAVHALFTAAGHARLTVIVPEAGPINAVFTVTGLDQVTNVVTTP